MALTRVCVTPEPILEAVIKDYKEMAEQLLLFASGDTHG